MLGLLTGVGLQAQNFVTGGNLNIGSGNSFGSYGNETYGNAIGVQNQVEGANTLVVGYSDTVSFGSTNSFAAGSHNRINGISSFAMGSFVKVNGEMSIGIGHYLKPGNEKSIVIGMGVKGNNNIPGKFLQNGYQHTIMMGMNSTKPTLTIGPSPNDYPQGDTLCKTGKVAIGDVPVPNIEAKLHIRADYGEDAGIILEPKDLERSNTFVRLRDESHQIQVDRDGNMSIESMDGNTNMPLLLTGRVGVNVTNVNKLVPEYALCVHGGIITEKVNIKSYSEWHDYVFAPDYALMPLSQLKDYVTVNHHLPDIPSEQEVLSQGLEIGEMQGLLLKKIEELTLYSIQLQEQMESMQKEIDELKNK